MKIAAFTVVVFLLIVSVYIYAQTLSDQPEYCKMVQRISNQHIQEMTLKGFTAIMTGGGLNQCVKSIAIGLKLNKKIMTVDEARLIYVSGIERLLARINSDTRIRPYLINYPFNVNNLDYQMDFEWLPVDASERAPIVFVSVIKGNILYRVDNPAYESTNSLRTIHREPYTEALRMVREAGQLPNDLDVP